MIIGMELLQGDTTQSSTHDVVPSEYDSGTDHDQFMRKLIGSSTKESRSTIRQRTMPWL
jgi:hypothetical protein